MGFSRATEELSREGRFESWGVGKESAWLEKGTEKEACLEGLDAAAWNSGVAAKPCQSEFVSQTIHCSGALSAVWPITIRRCSLGRLYRRPGRSLRPSAKVTLSQTALRPC